jgi:hypothetical protein
MSKHIAINATSHYPPMRRELRRWMKQQHDLLAPGTTTQKPRITIHGTRHNLHAIATGSGWVITYQYQPNPRGYVPQLTIDAHAQDPDADLFIQRMYRDLNCERINWAILYRYKETTIHRRGSITRGTTPPDTAR